MENGVINNEAGSRYELGIDGNIVSAAHYFIDGNTITFTHTITVAAQRGRGYAAIVVRAALDDARRRGLAVRAQCWFVADFIDAHGEYAALLSA